MSGTYSKFPPNCRVFIGNLASAMTSAGSLKIIFEKYGRLAEEPVIRKNFGFVQYLDERQAQAAIKQENGAIIGGLRIDLSLADNRPARRDNADDGSPRNAPAPGRAGKRERGGRDRGDRFHRDKSERTDVSTRVDRLARDERVDWRERDDSSHGGPRRKGNDNGHLEPDSASRRPPLHVKPPENINDVFLIRVDNPAKSYCLMIEEKITQMSLIYEPREVPLFDLPETLKVAAELSQVRHIMIIGSRHEPFETVTISTRLPSGVIEEFREMPLAEALRQLAASASFPAAMVADRGGAVPRFDAVGASYSASAESFGNQSMRELHQPNLSNPASVQNPKSSNLFGQQLDPRSDPRPSASNTSHPGNRGRLDDYPSGQSGFGQVTNTIAPSQPVPKAAPTQVFPQGLEPAGIHEMLQRFLQQVQNNGGQAALSNESTRAQLLQMLQSNPALVQFLVSKVQPQLASQAQGHQHPQQPALEVHSSAPPHQHHQFNLERTPIDSLTSGGYNGGGPPAPPMSYSSNKGGPSSHATTTGPNSAPGASWSGPSQGGFDRRGGGNFGVDPQSTSVGMPPSSGGTGFPSNPALAGLDIGILQDLLAATAPLLDPVDPAIHQQAHMSNWPGGGQQQQHHRSGPGGGPHGTGNPGGGFDGGGNPSSVDLLNLLARPVPGHPAGCFDEGPGGGGGRQGDSRHGNNVLDPRQNVGPPNGYQSGPPGPQAPQQMPPGIQRFGGPGMQQSMPQQNPPGAQRFFQR